MMNKKVEKLRTVWGRLAIENEKFYIRTTAWEQTDAEFYRSGKTDVERVADALAPYIEPRQSHILEIGCGIGRMTVWLAERFKQVTAVDISSVMIEIAYQKAFRQNIHYFHIPTSDLQDLKDNTFDAVACYWVFQHIPYNAIIWRYFEEIYRVLKNDGMAWLQFDTRLMAPWVFCYLKLPRWLDPLLPKNRRSGVRRYRLNPEELRSQLRRSGLAILGEENPGSEEHVFLLKKATG
jgi:ubiquinone/menaquinone biosynthesis C-methylase UbiE